MSPAGGYVKGIDIYDARQGLHVAMLTDFIRRSQPREWARFENVTKSDTVKKNFVRRSMLLATMADC
ncbi:MAG: hypothetical protein IKD80_05240 [Selenomonadaceae bacterium]|nr:hypothetical protein [Selenomonadaceae bacterium]